MNFKKLSLWLVIIIVFVLLSPIILLFSASIIVPRLPNFIIWSNELTATIASNTLPRDNKNLCNIYSNKWAKYDNYNVYASGQMPIEEKDKLIDAFYEITDGMRYIKSERFLTEDNITIQIFYLGLYPKSKNGMDGDGRTIIDNLLEHGYKEIDIETFCEYTNNSTNISEL